MGLDELIAMANEYAVENQGIIESGAAAAAPTPPEASVGGPNVEDPGNAAPMPDLTFAPPDLVQEATAVLVEAGVLDEVQATVSPELIQVLQGIADSVEPGLFDLSRELDLVEFLQGVADGTVLATAAPAPGPGPGPAGDPGVGVPGAGGIPGAGGVPGAGVPGTGA